ncbi:hypothetical protein BDV25DRAFT_138299 [Aspergillus avenaceus]|uniref:Mid2 domain-containing protein n=1 Tax=Aspergillus avenaceus TaxID=36643 RepID=A0A5N6U0C5_ASPAV|nr:hypothetical protein BDV25DRAFT_138299 [Aspergillus avenaceus]
MSTCFAMHSGRISTNIDVVACGVTNSSDSSASHVTCCPKGWYCMSNSFCYNPERNDTDTMYLNSDCTDEAMSDPACVTRCGGQVNSFINYFTSGGQGIWACCDYTNETVNCDTATYDQYPGPAPSKLTTLAYISSDGTASYASTATATKTATTNAAATTTSSSSNSSSSGIGPGAAAGIGVGVGVGAFMIAAGVAYFFFRKRRPEHSRLSDGSVTPGAPPAWYPEQQIPQQQMVYELGRPEPGELDSTERK